MLTQSKYCFLFIPLLTGAVATAQTNATPQAMITIVGDPAQTGNANDFINSDVNPYADNNTGTPPSPQQTAQMSQTVEPTLDNGFHMHFEVDSTPVVDRFSSSGYMSSGSSSGKIRKHSASITERSFNVKKRLNSWLPKRKKKYHPHLCGRF